MNRWTKQEYEDYMRKEFGGHTRDELADTFSGDADEGPESKLQGKIQKWCKEWGRPCLSFYKTKKVKGLIPVGWPDVLVLLPNGRHTFIELKAAKGRLSEEQKQMKLQFMHLGHTIHEVRSFRRFLEIMKGEKP